jgi:gas vesicle protein
MTTKKSNNKVAVGIGVAVGAIAGAVAGVLAAPQSGKATRADISKKAGEIKDEAEKDIEIVANKADKIIGEAKVIAGEAIKEVNLNVADLKERADYAIKGAKKGFIEKK